MSSVPIHYWVQQFITAMSGSVLIAPMALNGDGGARVALLTTTITMLIVKKSLLAITAGILAAALFRHL